MQLAWHIKIMDSDISIYLLDISIAVTIIMGLLVVLAGKSNHKEFTFVTINKQINKQINK